jgi:hypothetical protein
VPFEGDLFQVWELRDGAPVRMEMFFDREKHGKRPAWRRLAL